MFVLSISVRLSNIEACLHLPPRIHLREVSPRDGLQSAAVHLSTADKVALIDLLSSAGFAQINAVSFVSPRAMPHMSDAAEIMAAVSRRQGTLYDATVPNAVGAQRAAASGMDMVSVFVSASIDDYRGERTQDAAMEEACAAVAQARTAGMGVIGVVAKAFGCSVEGDIPRERVLGLARRFAQAGVDELCLGDTSGEAAPLQVSRMVGAMLEAFPRQPLSLHFHDTRGLGLSNVLAAMDAGATRFDAAVGGIGGSPQTRNSTGNISTEDLLHMCEDAGIETGIDLDIVVEAYRFLEDRLGHPLPGRVGRFGRSTRMVA
jgi:hydroxymethylglutaryl-CoA lyase